MRHEESPAELAPLGASLVLREAAGQPPIDAGARPARVPGQGQPVPPSAPRRSLKLRHYLAALFLGTVAPLVVLSGFLVYQVVASEQETVRQSMVDVARTLSATVDAEVGRTILALEVLARSSAIDEGDLVEFRRQAEAVRDLHGRWSNVGLVRIDGTRLMNLRIPADAHIPVGNDDAFLRAALERRKLISDLVTSPTSGKHLVYVSVPIVREGVPLYALSATMEYDLWTRWLGEQIPAGAVGAIDDRNGVIFARSGRPEAFVGRRAADELLAEYQRRPEGVVKVTNPLGEQVYGAFHTSPLTGWHSLIVMPAEAVDARAGRYMAGVAGTGLLVLLLAFVASLLVARPLRAATTDLRDAITALGRGRRPQPRLLPIEEFDEAHRSAEQAGALLRDAQRALENRTEQFEALLASAPIGVYLVDASCRLTAVNPAAHSFFLDIGDANGKDFREVMRALWGATAEDLLRGFERTLSTAEPSHFAELVEPRRGRVYEWHMERLLMPDGGHGVVCYFRDLTRKVRAREEVVRQREELQTIYATAPVGLCVLDRALRFERINAHMAEMNGVTIEDHLGRTVREVLPGLADMAEPALQKVIDSGEPVLDVEVVGETPARPGYARTWIESWYPLKAPDGAVRGINVVAREVTEQRMAEAALRASEERFRVAQESSLVAFTILRAVRDETGAISDFEWVYANPAAASILRRPVHDLVGHRLLQVLPGNRPSGGLFDAYVRVVETGKGHNVEVPYDSDGIRGAFQNVCSRLGDGVAVWFMDVSERRRATEEIARQREELQTMLDIIPVGVAIARDPRADHIVPSPRFAELLGIPRDGNASLTAPGGGRPSFRCTRDGIEVPPDELPMQQAARTQREVRDAEFDLELADGRVLNVMVSAAPLFDGEGRVRGAIGAHVDITALKRIQRQLEAADRQKDEFLAMLAHELRNPLTPIRNAGELLARAHPDDREAQLVVGIIRRQVTQLTRLVDDLLDVSRITRGRIELRREIIDLADVVAHAVETVEPVMREKRHELTILSGHHRLRVHGDFARLVQCVVNVLANAAKYTEPGGRVRIETRAEETEAVVAVTDNGSGISPELLPHVFDLFVQGRRTLDRAQGGLGIGLSVVQQLIERQGGRVRASSKGLGHGATFEIRLPRVDAPVPAHRLVAGGPIRPRRVLIVDDNVDAADSLAMVLRLDGHAVDVVHSGEDAVERCRAFGPEVVLLDIGLPGIDGYEVARRLRALPGGAEVRLVALTGYGQADDRARAKAAGFDDHIVKPIDMQALLKTLEVAGNSPPRR